MAEITQEDRSAAVDAIRRIAGNGFAVGCCTMSLSDADEMAAYIAKDFARHRERAIEALQADNARLREALERVLSHRYGDWTYIARAALQETGQ